jgi:hypothetical protein
MENPEGCAMIFSHNCSIGCLSRQNLLQQPYFYVQKWPSTERQRLLALHHRECKGCTATWIHNRTIGPHSRQNGLRQHCFYLLKMSVNGTSMTFGHASWKINWLSGYIKPQSYYWPSFMVKSVARTWLICPHNECQRSVNNFWLCIIANARVR